MPPDARTSVGFADLVRQYYEKANIGKHWFEVEPQYRQAMEAIFHAGSYSFDHRKDKKGDFRRLWNVRMAALLKQNGTSYSKFIPLLKKANVALDRKILAGLAENHPETFVKILESVS